MRKFKAGVPLFAIILTLLALGTMAFKGVVNKKGVETSKVVLAEQWYDIEPVDPLVDIELQTNQRIIDEDSEPTGFDCNRDNSGAICGVTISFTGAIPPTSLIGKTIAVVLAENLNSTATYTRIPL